MFFTESWLKPQITDSMVCPKGFSIIRADRLNKHGGGVALLYKERLRITPVNLNITSIDPYTDNFEFICVDLFNPDKTRIRLLCFYIPPSPSKCASTTETDEMTATKIKASTIKAVCHVIKSLTNPLYPCYIVGDFNLPQINWSIPTTCGGPSHKIFLDFCTTNCLTQCINVATHEKENILDLLLCNEIAYNKLLCYSIKSPLTSSCDHNVISLTFETADIDQHEPEVQIPLYSKGDYSSISNELLNMNWEPLNMHQFDLQSYYDNFILRLQDLVTRYVPNSSPAKQKPKLSRKVKQLLNKKLRAYRQLKRGKTSKARYKQVCKQYEQEVKHWTDRVESDLCKHPTSKKFYGYINRQLRTKRTIPPLVNHKVNQLCFEDAEKAALLNDQFHDVFTQDDGKMPFVYPVTNCFMDNFTIDSSDILQAISKLKGKICRTPENIPSYMIKKIGRSILRPLLILFNNSLYTGKIPKQWKISYIVPVYKKGNRNLPKNYRPISLTSGFSRLFEIIIHQKILSYLLTNSLLSPSQHGFLPERSACSQLLSCIHEWLWAFVNGKTVDVLYMDIAKAFDSVSHTKLICVLQSFGICHNVVAWIEEFLSNRQQHVCIGRSVSPGLQVLSGVPQGGVIGPLLFVIYMDGMCKHLDLVQNNVKLKLFADDAKIYGQDHDHLQMALNNVSMWTSNRQLCLASEKCFVLSISKTKPNLFDQDSSISDYSIGTSQIVAKQLITDLGVVISDNLTWRHHIDKIYKKASYRSYQISKCLRTNNIWTLIKLFTTYVRPILESNTSVWSPFDKGNIKRIESIQQSYTRMAFRRCGISFTSYGDRLRKVNLKSLEERRLVFDLVLVYKIVYGLSDLNFTDYFISNNSNYSLRRHPLQIKCIKNNSNQQWQNSFFYRVVKIWNSLPEDVVRTESISSFKSKLTTVFLSRFTKLNVYDE
jgi:hypothetical protein